MKRAESVHRNKITSAVSSDVPSRPIGVAARTPASICSFEKVLWKLVSVSPGTIDTNFHKTFSNEQMLAGVRAATPMGRLGTSEETADVILFLCTDSARFIQGQVIEVNGGFLMV